MLKVEWLRTLQDVSQQGSFSAVALKRGVSAMAISKHIAGLEQQVGEALLNRSTRHITLTEAGQSLLEKSQILLEEHGAIEAWLAERHGEPAGNLTVIIAEEHILRMTVTPWVGEFLQRYPKVKLTIHLMTDFNQLQSVKADVYWGLSKYLGDVMPGLKRKSLIETAFGIYGSHEYFAQHGVPQTPTDLANHYVIGNTHNTPQNSLVVRGGKDFNDGFLEGVFLPTYVVTDANGEEYAAQGLGLINGATAMVDHTRSPWDRLIPVLQDYWVGGVQAYAYYHQTKIEQPKVRAFIDFFFAKCEQWVQR